MTSPNPSDASTTVRSPGTASAPNEARGPTGHGSVRPDRVGQREPDRARHDQPTSATAVPVPGHGSATSSAASDGPRMKNTSRLIAS